MRHPLLGRKGKIRWTEGKNNPVDNEGGAIGNGILITRDTVVSSEIKLGRGKNSPKTTVEYRVLGLYDKYYNKWFMTGEAKGWEPLMAAVDKKKYRLAILMIEDGRVEKYDDVELDDARYNLKDICKVIDGSEIVDVKGKYIQSVL